MGLHRHSRRCAREACNVHGASTAIARAEARLLEFDEAIICGFFVLCRSFLYQSVAEERFSSITLRVRNQVHHENGRLSSVILSPFADGHPHASRLEIRQTPRRPAPRIAPRIRYRADCRATSKPPIAGRATRPSESRCRTSPPRVHICMLSNHRCVKLFWEN